MTRWRRTRQIVFVALAYLVAASLGQIVQLGRLPSLIWPPSGFALAILLLYGGAAWPGIAIGIMVVVLARGGSLGIALWITAVDLSEAIVGFVLLRDVFHVRPALDRLRDVLALIGVAFVITLCSSFVCVGGLVAAGAIDGRRFQIVSSIWWWNHFSADLLVAPLVLTWVTRRSGPKLERRPAPLEVVALVIAVVVVDVLVFSRYLSDWLPGASAAYYVLPMLLWAGVRFGPRGGTAATFFVSVMAIMATSLARGPFDDLGELHGFIAVASITTLVISAVAIERTRALGRKAAIQFCALDAIVTVDSRGRILEFNPAAEQLLGRRASETLGRSAMMFVPRWLVATYQHALQRFMRQGAGTTMGRRYRTVALRADGTEVPVETSVAAYPFEKDKLLTAFIRDMSAEQAAEHARREAHAELERKVAERTADLVRINRELERGEELLRQAEELAQLGSFELDVESKRLEWSDELFRIYGRDRATWQPTYDRFLSAVLEEDRDRVRATIEAAIAEGKPFSFEDRISRPDGSIRILESRGRVFHNGSVRIAGCCQDVTDAKYAEEALGRLVQELQVSLREKEVLLREIHHRVKNNLQVISSLLHLQLASESSAPARTVLLESQSRILSMALVHQLLYQSRDLARIDIGEYLRDLIHRLFQTYDVGSSKVELTLVTAEGVLLDIDQAVPCGLIVNELVANALQHAFPDGRSGHLSVSLALDQDTIVIVVRDDGIGIPEDFAIDTPHTFGLQIARTLTQQLDGTITLAREAGTVARVSFVPKPTRDSGSYI